MGLVTSHDNEVMEMMGYLWRTLDSIKTCLPKSILGEGKENYARKFATNAVTKKKPPPKYTLTRNKRAYFAHVIYNALNEVR